jgi:hypothetical protein
LVVVVEMGLEDGGCCMHGVREIMWFWMEWMRREEEITRESGAW